MSDLQWSLLALGAVVIAGVLVFNWYQERSHRRRAEEVFDTPPKDILLGTDDERIAADVVGDHGRDVGADAIIPATTVPAAPELPLPASDPVPDQAVPDVTDEVVIDSIATFESTVPFDDTFLVRLGQTIGELSRTTRLLGLDDLDGRWLALSDTSAGRHRRIRVAMQLVDRQAVVSRAELEEFERAMRMVAEESATDVTVSDVDAMEARAQELDTFCGDVDIAIGLSVVARTGQMFQGTTIRALAESAGLKLRADGQFHSEDSQGSSQFTLDNQDTEPFFPDSIKGLTTTGVTFLLDVPRAEGGVAAYDRMVQVTKKFAATLDGNIVDDNRQPLNDNGLDTIRRHLVSVYLAMDEKGIPAGSPVAMRLFS
ncbi:MAG: hypothetical protein GC151_13385 [Betaproteobacteria bacterium]|nr:hypothetical protein [Betaproteobacteria bacterium]